MMNALNARLDTIIQPALNMIAPAVTLAVMYRGETIIHRAWGVVDPRSLDMPVTVETRFDLASLTKLYTTTALLVLLTHKNITLTTPLVDLLPEFGEVNPRHIDGGQDPHTKEQLPVPDDLKGQTVNPVGVTLRHLLSHTAGLPPWRDIYSVLPVPAPPDQPESLNANQRWQAALAQLVQLPFVDHIGSSVRYSDVGLMLLGAVIARLADMDLARAVQTYVLQPAQLHKTGFNPMREMGIDRYQIVPTEFDATWRKRRVWGEVHDENACGLGGIAGHAGLFATALDVARFGATWLERSVFDMDSTIYASAITEQAVTGAERRGLGWMLPSYENSSAGDRMSRSAYGHTGFTGTSLWIDPVHECVVTLLTNRVYVGRDVPGIHALRRAVHDAVMEAIV
ncbi:MAG: serine hydrolase domain-containing protein [Chloroflexota bacterium]